MKAKIDYGLLDSLKADVDTFIEDVAEHGKADARSHYSSKVYVGVFRLPNGKYGNECTVTAKGFTMPFEEYGAGMLAISDIVGGVVVGEGTWSAEHQQQYTRWGMWVHNGQTYRFVRPTYALHNAVYFIRRNVYNMAFQHFRRYL